MPDAIDDRLDELGTAEAPDPLIELVREALHDYSSSNAGAS
jgi:hypothetical protein